MPAEILCTNTGQPVYGPLLITPKVFADERGFFYESWNERRFREDLIAAGVTTKEAESLKFHQDNHSRSAKGVLRGLHFQLPPETQGKLVRCSVGAIFDVVVDLRRNSPTYGEWAGTRHICRSSAALGARWVRSWLPHSEQSSRSAIQSERILEQRL